MNKVSRYFLVILMGVLLCGGKGRAQGVSELWVARYNRLTHYDDKAKYIAIDSNGNVCVLGDAYQGVNVRIVLVKYDNLGNELWTETYDAFGQDYARGLALDSSDNIYITGYTRRDSTYNWITIKYNAAGESQWEVTHTEPSAEVDCMVLADDGSVFVTGSGESRSHLTIKYDQDGNEQWLARYNDPYIYTTIIMYDIALDSTGNLYMSGYAYVDGNKDYLTIKYDPDGNELWVARYNGVYNDSDEAHDIEIDDDGYVFVAGETDNNSTGTDFQLVKYDSDGQELWATSLSASGYAEEDIAYRLSLDEQSNAYLAGCSDCKWDSDYFTAKFNEDGDFQWSQLYDGSGRDEIRELVLDSEGNVIVTGISDMDISGSVDYDIMTIKYNTNGTLLWAESYDDPGNGDNYPTDMVIDDDNNIYICSDVLYSQRAWVLLKYDSNGNELWSSRGPYVSVPYAITLDETGNVYVTGYGSDPNIVGDYYYLTVKYDNDGNELWQQYYSGNFYYSMTCDIAVDSTGDVYVTGATVGEISIYSYKNITTIKYSPEGEELWVHEYGDSYNNEYCKGMGLDNNGDVYVYGDFFGTCYDYGIYKLFQQPGSDADEDGIIDEVDNCPEVANVDQLDSDADGVGDVCDPNNDEYGEAIALDYGVGYNGSTHLATGLSLSACAFRDMRDVWHSFTPPVRGDYMFSLCSSSLDTTLMVYDPNMAAEMRCNVDCCGEQSTVKVALNAGQTYYVRVAGYNEKTGDYTLRCFLAGDLDLNVKVDLLDFALFGSEWLIADCYDCNAADFDCDEQVEMNDLHEFTTNWLAGTP
ncbi:MAG: SBBP repeat-containing protein [Sedimentisphaerales bacterium]|nr:SBBP repeat-containing protein [Sedimentisphaerales bacterium]